MCEFTSTEIGFGFGATKTPQPGKNEHTNEGSAHQALSEPKELRDRPTREVLRSEFGAPLVFTSNRDRNSITDSSQRRPLESATTSGLQNSFDIGYSLEASPAEVRGDSVGGPFLG